VALKLMDQGYTNVHALSGGLDAWKDAGFPMAPLATQAPLRLM
jgi:rhodanese-related sulfurtransferase